MHQLLLVHETYDLTKTTYQRPMTNINRQLPYCLNCIGMYINPIMSPNFYYSPDIVDTANFIICEHHRN